MAGTATKKAEITTVAFANPSIRVAKKGDRDEYVIRSQRGWPITTSDKYPTTPFEQMLVDEAKKNGGKCKVLMEVSINLNQKAEVNYNTDDIDFMND